MATYTTPALMTATALVVSMVIGTGNSASVPQVSLRSVAAKYGRPPASWPTAIIFTDVVSLFLCLFIFCLVSSEIAWPIVTKFSRVFGSARYLKKCTSNI